MNPKIQNLKEQSYAPSKNLEYKEDTKKWLKGAKERESTPEWCPQKHNKKKTDGNVTIQDLRIEFNKEIETLRRTQAKINMKLKTL